MLSKIKDLISDKNLEEINKIKKELEDYGKLVPVELFSEEYRESKELIESYLETS